MVQAISSKEEFDNLLKEKSWVIIADFYATVDEVWELAEEYWISSIPTVFIWYNHEIQEGFLGAYPKDFYEDKIEHVLWEKKA